MITAAITGGVTSKKDNPNLPILPDEIAQAAYDCWNAGASIVHIHARDRDGKATQSVEIYQEIVEKIRSKCNILICLTTSGWNTENEYKNRTQYLSCNPEFASLVPGSMNRGNQVYINSPELVEKLAIKIQEVGAKPEIEIFDFGMIEQAKKLLRKNLLKEPLTIQFVFGIDGGIIPSTKNLVFLVESIPSNSNWFVAAVGRWQLSMNILGILMGGHIRTGFEDNVYYRYRELGHSNAQLVERIVQYARELGREIADPKEAKEMLWI